MILYAVCTKDISDLWSSVKAMSSHQPRRMSIRSGKRAPHEGGGGGEGGDRCCEGGGGPGGRGCPLGPVEEEEGAEDSLPGGVLRPGAARFMAVSSGLTRERPVAGASRMA